MRRVRQRIEPQQTQPISQLPETGQRFRPNNYSNLQRAVFRFMFRDENGNVPLDTLLKYGTMDTWDISRINNLSHLFNDFHDFHDGDEEYVYTFNNIHDNISNWDVSHVTDMYHLFSRCSSFNQDLNGWNVSNVTDMAGMFAYCSSFNKPLNNWDVSRVTDMREMFTNCTSFNQDLNDWNVHNVRDTFMMFSGCQNLQQHFNRWTLNFNWRVNESRMFERCARMQEPMPDGSMPTLPVRGQIIQAPPPAPQAPPANDHAVPVAFQIHSEYNKINKQKLLDILNEPGNLNPSTIQQYNILIRNDDTFIINFIKDKITQMLNNTDIFTIEEKTSKLPILQYLLNVSYIPIEINKELILKSFEFMLSQPNPVIKSYISNYINECGMAYGINTNETNFNTANVSCVKGRFERFITLMKTVFLENCLENQQAELCKPIYIRILKEVFSTDLTRSVKELNYSELVQQWDTDHLENAVYHSQHNVDQMDENAKNEFFKNDFVQYMTQKYTEHNLLTPEITTKINHDVTQFEAMGTFRDMHFGGKKRSQKRNRKRRKQRKTMKKRRKSVKRKNKHQ